MSREFDRLMWLANMWSGIATALLAFALYGMVFLNWYCWLSALLLGLLLLWPQTAAQLAVRRHFDEWADSIFMREPRC